MSSFVPLPVGGDPDEAAGAPGGGDPAEAIRQLCSSSGVASVPELVSAMLAQQESHQNLLDMRAAAKEQVRRLWDGEGIDTFRMCMKANVREGVCLMCECLTGAWKGGTQLGNIKPPSQVEELELEMASAKSQLEDVLGGGKLTTQSQLDAAQGELREATAKADEARHHHDQVCEVVVGKRGGWNGGGVEEWGGERRGGMR
jgi:hypothetical protein